MPSRQRGDAPPLDLTLCRRCQINEPNITVRTEPLCQGCFNKYVTSKVVKRMESFRVRNANPRAQRTLLLPFSFGTSSLSLLYILSRHMKGQMERTGRTGFKLHLCHVQADNDHADESPASSLLDRIRTQYPEHSYSSVTLSDACNVDEIATLFPDLLSEGHNRRLALSDILALLPSATARTDLSTILRRRLLVAEAKDHLCEAILWADSTTRLAERTLAETAKGRGGALPSFVTDGDATFGLPFYYPMRDLLSKEIVAFARMTPDLADALLLSGDAEGEVGNGETRAEDNPAVVNSKNLTIDALMRQYFASVEQEYPSIVANVVKTTGKLEKSVLGTSVEEQCELCEVHLSTGSAPEKSRVCYACIRTLPSGVS